MFAGIVSGQQPLAVGGGGAVVVESSALTLIPAQSSSTINLPPGIESGDVLLFLYGGNGSGNPSLVMPAGWTFTLGAATTSSQLVVASKVADGTEGATMTITRNAGAAFNAAVRVFRIAGSTGNVEIGTALVNNGDTANCLFTPFTHSGSAVPTLWMLACNVDDTNLVSVSNYPTNYVDGTYDVNGDGQTTSGNLLHAYKQSSTDTESPDAIVWNDVIARYATRVLAIW